MNNKILIVSANYYKEISKNLELGAAKRLKKMVMNMKLLMHQVVLKFLI